MPIRKPLLCLALVAVLGGCGPAQPPPAIIHVLAATEAQEARLRQAADRFAEAGLELPALTVRFSDRVEDCGGRMGQFESTERPWRITICGSADFLYEHELAHAWEKANLSDEDRHDFTALSGHESWASSRDSWMDRGVEGVAFIIQQGLLTSPLAHPLSPEMARRMELFEFLTGRPSPRLSHELIGLGQPEPAKKILPPERGSVGSFEGAGSEPRRKVPVRMVRGACP